MYRAVVIYCLIAVGYAAVSPVYYENRETRQAQTVPPVPAAPPTSTKQASNNNNTQLPYPYPTYPEYVQKDKESPVPETVPPQKNSELTVPGEKSGPPSFLSSLKPYVQSLVLYSIRTGNYLLQILGVVLLGTSVVSLICSYTSVCNLLEINQVKELARMYASPEHMNDLTMILVKAIDKYSNMQQNTKMKT